MELIESGRHACISLVLKRVWILHYNILKYKINFDISTIYVIFFFTMQVYHCRIEEARIKKYSARIFVNRYVVISTNLRSL